MEIQDLQTIKEIEMYANLDTSRKIKKITIPFKGIILIDNLTNFIYKQTKQKQMENTININDIKVKRQGSLSSINGEDVDVFKVMYKGESIEYFHLKKLRCRNWQIQEDIYYWLCKGQSLNEIGSPVIPPR
jgi:hypothetical protein